MVDAQAVLGEVGATRGRSFCAVCCTNLGLLNHALHQHTIAQRCKLACNGGSRRHLRMGCAVDVESVRTADAINAAAFFFFSFFSLFFFSVHSFSCAVRFRTQSLSAPEMEEQVLAPTLSLEAAEMDVGGAAAAAPTSPEVAAPVAAAGHGGVAPGG